MSDNVTYPVLPLRDIVVFPSMIVPLFVGREKSVNALENVMQNDKKILLVAQKDAGDDDPAVDDIFDVGVVASILQLLKLPDGTVKVLVEGEGRAKIKGFKPVLIDKNMIEGDGRWYALDDDPSERAVIAEEVLSPEAYLEGATSTISVLRP